MRMKFEIELNDIDQVLDSIDPRIIERYLRKKKMEKCINPTELPPIELKLSHGDNSNNYFNGYSNIESSKISNLLNNYRRL